MASKNWHNKIADLELTLATARERIEHLEGQADAQFVLHSKLIVTAGALRDERDAANAKLQQLNEKYVLTKRAMDGVKKLVDCYDTEKCLVAVGARAIIKGTEEQIGK